jgi:hypothetical protein
VKYRPIIMGACSRGREGGSVAGYITAGYKGMPIGIPFHFFASDWLEWLSSDRLGLGLGVNPNHNHKPNPNLLQTARINRITI